MKRPIRQWLVFCAAALCAPAAAAGLDTDSLDRTFGEMGDGRQVIDLPGTHASYADAIAIDGQNRIVMGGSMVSATDNTERGAVMRLLPDGTPDPAFATLPSPLPYNTTKVYWTTVAVQPNGEIFAAGSAIGPSDQDICGKVSKTCWIVCKLRNDGSFDSLFGAQETPGCTVPTTQVFGYAQAMAIQHDGKVLIAGQARSPVSRRAAIIRLDASGALDETFAEDGVALLPEQYYEPSAFFALDTAADGTIAAAGYYGSDLGIGMTDEHMLVARYSKDGVPMQKFSGGVRVIPFLQNPVGERISAARSVRVLLDHSVMVGGETAVNVAGGDMRYRPAVAKLDANGNGVTAYGMAGLPAGQRIIDICTDATFNCRDLTAASRIDVNGGVWIAGEVTHTEFELTRVYGLRLTPQGKIDPAFGSSDGAFVPGVASVYWPDQEAGSDAFDPNALAIQKGKIVLAGITENLTTDKSAAIRLDNGTLFADDFESD